MAAGVGDCDVVVGVMSPFAITPGEIPQKAPCSECGTRIPIDDLHPVEVALPPLTHGQWRTKNPRALKYYCDTCCPNCFGGAGQGPSSTKPEEA